MMPDRPEPTGWATRLEFEEWWKRNVIAFNRLAVTDPPLWEHFAAEVERFQRENPQ